jgi:diguanylate cyclase (GGDEF)-like protein
VVEKASILIAEDEKNLREILRFQLENAGFDVVEACDGQEALDLATAHLPDLVLLDVMMPRLSGYEVCRQMRASFLTRHVPIIMLTAKSESIDKVTGLDGGANDYLTKPWEREELVARVRNVLEWSRQQRAASPLTGLPGNHSINEEIRRRMDRAEPFAMMQIDIDFFKAFNDRYGYARGDGAIQALAHLLVDSARGHDPDDTFIGHIGGDDFVVVTGTESAEAMGLDIISRFNAMVPSLYDAVDVSAGYVEVPDRQHAVQRFPVMTLTIALVSTDRMPVQHLAHLTDIAQELKANGKGIPGSVLVGERRSILRERDQSAA